MKLGKIKKIDLRGIWKSESFDFTPWLAKEDNIALLGEAIGIDLEVESQEKNVGPFRADILARDTGTGHYVLIENQLETTDHSHLGQIMTYAAGLDAFSIIWIAKSFTEEHRAALDWLNRITDENVNFFGIEIEVIQIGDSPAAPQFKVVTKPNGWSKSVRFSANRAELTDTKIKQQEYWAGLKAYVEANGTPFKVQKPAPQHWTNVAIGRSGFNMALSVNSQKNQLNISLEMNGSDASQNKAYFDELKANFEDEAKIAISPELSWQRMDDKKVSIILLTGSFDFLNAASRQAQFAWFLENVMKFQKFFRNKIKAL